MLRSRCGWLAVLLAAGYATTTVLARQEPSQIPGQGEGGPVPEGAARMPIANPHYNIVDARGKAVAATTDTTSGTHENAIHVPGLSFEAVVQPLLAKNCSMCHNAKLQ